MAEQKRHYFNADFAVQYGLEEAIVIHRLRWQVEWKRGRRQDYRDGRTWVYDSYAKLAAAFPYWNANKIRRIIESLVEQGVLVKCQFRKAEGDLTNWYAFADEARFLAVETDEETHPANLPDGMSKTTDGLANLPDHLANLPDHKDVSVPFSVPIGEEERFPVTTAPAPLQAATVEPETPRGADPSQTAPDTLLQDCDAAVFAYCGESSRRPWIATLAEDARRHRELGETVDRATLISAGKRGRELWDAEQRERGDKPTTPRYVNVLERALADVIRERTQPSKPAKVYRLQSVDLQCLARDLRKTLEAADEAKFQATVEDWRGWIAKQFHFPPEAIEAELERGRKLALDRSGEMLLPGTQPLPNYAIH